MIKCGPRHIFDALQKGVGRLRWDSASTVGSGRGYLGETGPLRSVWKNVCVNESMRN